MSKGNTGCYNKGNRNTGDFNTGYSNTGNFNTGGYNKGNYNTGDSNTGNRNTGDFNTGNYNTGSWNTGSYNTGFFNTVTPERILVFNKPCKIKDLEDVEKPYWMSMMGLTRWVNEAAMTDEEKEENPSHEITGGYLKSYDSLQDAYKDAWDNASEEDRAKTFDLPNFDVEVFKEIFGFDPSDKKTKKVTLELTEEQIESLKEQGLMD